MPDRGLLAEPRLLGPNRRETRVDSAFPLSIVYPSAGAVSVLRLIMRLF
jgi:hypothetical protein